MRNFDNWLEYLVDGKPFFGRLTFFKLHTTEKITITSESGVALSNPILSDAYGRTSSQVFLPDEDITVLMESFIGSGEMSDNAENISAWKEERTFDSLKNSVVIDVEGNAVMATVVGNVTELRALDASTYNYAMLCGYDTLGDMPPVYYKAVEDSNSSEDGGSVFRHDSSHIWKLIPPHIIDCRVFGIFPKESISELDTSQSQIHSWLSYANSMSKDVYMPKVFVSAGYYLLYGGNETFVRGRMIIDNNVHLVAKANTTTRLTLAEIQYNGTNLFYADGNYGVIICNCPTVNAEWKSTNWLEWSGTVKRFYVNSLDSWFTFRNAEVIFTGEISNKQLEFENCQISSVKKINNCEVYLDNCGKITDYWFGDNVTAHVSNNEIDIANIENPNTYIDWKNQQLETNYGDLGERTISSVSLLSGAVVENANFTNVTVNGSCELHNVSGSIIGNGDNLTLNLVDSWIQFVNTSQTHSLKHIDLRRGSFISGSSNNLIEACLFDNATIGSQLVTPYATSTFRNCTINATLHTYDVHVENCTVSAAIVTFPNPTTNKYSFRITGNTFLTGGSHQLANGNIAGAKVDGGYWLNNCNLSGSMFVVIDRTNMDLDESHHNYEYENNKGPNTYQRLSAEWEDTIYMGSNRGQTDQLGSVSSKELNVMKYLGEIHEVGDTRLQFMGFQGRMYADSGAVGGTTNTDVYLTEFYMFSVGTENVGTLNISGTFPSAITADMDTTGTSTIEFPWLTGVVFKTPSPVNQVEKPWFSLNYGFPKGISFMQGYKWRVTHVPSLFAWYPNFGYSGSAIDWEVPIKYRLERF